MPFINQQDASNFSQGLQNNLGSAGVIQSLKNLLGQQNIQLPVNPEMSLQAKLAALKQLQSQNQGE